MDLVAIAIAVLTFAVLLGSIELIDRVWAAPTSSGWPCQLSCSSTSSTRWCARSGS